MSDGGNENERHIDAAWLFVVEDVPAETCSPVFEQSSVASAKRIFINKTLKDMPEGFVSSDFVLWLVGRRLGSDVFTVKRKLMEGDKDAE